MTFPLKTEQYILGIINNPDFGYLLFRLLNRFSIRFFRQRAKSSSMDRQRPLRHGFSTLTITKFLWCFNCFRNHNGWFLFLRLNDLVFFHRGLNSHPSPSSLKFVYRHLSHLSCQFHFTQAYPVKFSQFHHLILNLFD